MSKPNPKLTDAEIVARLVAFYAHATGPEGLGQYQDEDGDVTDYYRYDHHLADIEADAFELIGRLVAERT